MKRYSVLLFAVILSGAVACAPSTPSGSAPKQPPLSATLTPTPLPGVANVTPTRAVVPTVGPTVAPNPLNVQVKVDNQISASAVISTTGGTLSVVGADGTKFTLTFPKGALLNDEKITLTPITAVDGLPFSGGLVGGVQMAPEGLRLLKPATLTIESAKTVAAKGFETVAFGYHQNGEGLYLTPSEVKGNILTLEVWHFTGDAAAQATSAEIQTQQQQHVPSNAEDAFTQRVREYLGRERQAQLLPGQNPDPEFERTMGEFLREGYDRFIGPQLPIALTDCDAAPAILSRALGWLRQVQLLGYGDRFQAESTLITNTMLQVLVNCYNKAYDKCVANDDLSQMVVMLGYLRQGQLLGVGDRMDQSKIEKCGTFELKFDSTIDATFPQAGGGVGVFSSVVRTTVPMKLTLVTNSAEGSAPLDYVSFSLSGLPCLQAAPPRGGTFQATRLDLGLSPDPAQRGRYNISLMIDVGTTQETYSSTCPEVPFSLTDSLYTKFFADLHAAEKAGIGYQITNWQPGAAGIIGLKTYQGSKPCAVGGTCKETTKLQLIHKAQ